MANEKKMTKREKFEILAKLPEVESNPMLAEFIAHELELLAKKNASGEGKLTASQKINEGIKAEILEEMSANPNRLYSISEMIKLFKCCKDLSLPKVTSLVTQLVKAECVERVEEKRKAFFRYKA
jgi:predicted transcriptional regulator